jgi:hypothetical protein
MRVDIQIPYTTRPMMKQNHGPVFNSQPDKRYLDQKIVELEKFDSDLYAETFESKTNHLIEKACQYLNLPPKTSIKDFALMFEEDVAIMHRGILSAICFCFPSSWVPAERIGLTLSDIHKPVADGDKLVQSSYKLSSTMADTAKGSFTRQVWTITQTEGLSNHPVYKSSNVPTSINDLFLRVETQTTAAIGDNQTSLFFVKIDVVPLVEVWHLLGNQLKMSVNSMSDSVLQYKNLTHIKPILNRILLM